jgi:hypothetical protein
MGMLRGGKDLGGLSLSDDHAALHDRDVLADGGGNAQVTGDEDD